MATPATSIKLHGLARSLVTEGTLSEEQAHNAQLAASESGVSLFKHLLENDIANPASIALASSREYGIPLFDLATFDIENIPQQFLNENLAMKHHALPLFKRGNRLFVAISDPMNLAALDEIKFNTGIPTEPIIVEDDKLLKIIEAALDAADTSLSDMDLDEDLDNLNTSGDPTSEIDTSDIDDTPVVRFVNKLLLDSINKGASDIHLEPFEKTFRVRIRADGVMHEVASPPVALASRIIARVKVMSRMDISERRIPQDGRIKLQISKSRAIDFRVNTCPTLYGEKIVLRILDPSSAKLGIDHLGYEEDQKQLYLEALKKPYGMILVTGPTGSGKTVSLYTGLNILNTVDRNISTAEDPAEINVPGINQVNVNPKVGLTFAEALRAFLRQDPDIIMVGEIRDLETAEIAIKASQTGHLVLSTLHTNDAPQTLTRLANMGVPPYNIAASVSLIIAQRLARRLCEHCKTLDDVPEDILLSEGFNKDETDDIKIYKPVGCEQCNDGYKGRVGIYQVMPVSEEMGRLIMEGGNSIQLAEQSAKEGIDDLRKSGLRKVRAGIIGLEELNRVTKD